MIQFNVRFRPYSYYGNNNNYDCNMQSTGASEEQQFSQILKRETVSTWKYDEEGNIVYYTYDKQTGEIINKVTYKNPNKDFINHNV